MPLVKGNPDRNDIIRAAKRGDVTAQHRLHDLCAAALSDYIAQRSGPALRRHVSMSDLCQEAFHRAFRAIGLLSEDATLDEFKGLLFQHAGWVLADKGNKARNYKGESALEEGLHEALVAPNSTGSKGSVTREDERRWLESCIERLDPDQAAVIRLRLDGLSFVEIGRKLDIDKDAARRRYLRGATKLRGLIARNGGGPRLP